MKHTTSRATFVRQTGELERSSAGYAVQAQAVVHAHASIQCVGTDRHGFGVHTSVASAAVLVRRCMAGLNLRKASAMSANDIRPSPSLSQSSNSSCNLLSNKLSQVCKHTALLNIGSSCKLTWKSEGAAGCGKLTASSQCSITHLQNDHEILGCHLLKQSSLLQGWVWLLAPLWYRADLCLRGEVVYRHVHSICKLLKQLPRVDCAF